jgi:hypothetical protein
MMGASNQIDHHECAPSDALEHLMTVVVAVD